MHLRDLAEMATHRLIIQRRLPEKFDSAPMYVTSEGGLRYLFKKMSEVDPQLLWLADTFVREKMVVWDVGGNLGLFTIASAVKSRRAGQVITLEPDPQLITLLRRSAREQSEDAAPITVVPCACAREIGLATFLIARHNRATNYLQGYGSSVTGGVREQQTVMTISLDWLSDYFPKPQVLKIDVEAAELEVLEGASKLLADCKPILIIEVASSNADRIAEILGRLGYIFYDIQKLPDERTPVPRPTGNTLALPSGIW